MIDLLGFVQLQTQTIPRANPVHWEWLVYLEMFLAGIAAGAYVMAAILEVLGRGRSSVARTAHLIAFPLMAAAGLLLIVDLSRPERFWHMIVQSGTLLPMFKPWSPMSLGSWGVLIFPAFAFVSFLDALIDRDMLKLGGWRRGRTLHGSGLGKLWAIGGGLFAFLVGAYSGMLLNVTNFPGWFDSPFISPLYVATAAVTGLAALLLFESLRRPAPDSDVPGVLRATTILIVWQALMFVLFLATMGSGARGFLSGAPLVGIVGAALLGMLIPLGLLLSGATARKRAMAMLTAVLILAAGFMLRYAVVMGPQHG